jgi:TGF-beta propeptide
LRFKIFNTFLKDHHLPEMRHAHGRRLWFDTSEIGHDYSLMMAELRLYQNSIFSKFEDEEVKPVTVRVYKADLRNE